MASIWTPWERDLPRLQKALDLFLAMGSAELPYDAAVFNVGISICGRMGYWPLTSFIAFESQRVQ